tara:strand:+ start:2990 stop:3445 length:456 start_codon:yes stop_codon:yes gene_type:complete
MPIVKKIKGSVSEVFEKGEISLLVNNISCTKDPADKEKPELAKKLYEKFEIIEEIHKAFPLPALYKLGDYSVASVAQSASVLNFYTALIEDHFEYSALKSCLKKLSMEGLSSNQYIEVAFSKKNIGDADWKTVEQILHLQEQLLITVYDND